MARGGASLRESSGLRAQSFYVYIVEFSEVRIHVKVAICAHPSAKWDEDEQGRRDFGFVFQLVYLEF